MTSESTKGLVSLCDTRGKNLLAKQGDIGKEKRVEWGNSLKSEVMMIKRKNEKNKLFLRRGLLEQGFF